MLSLSDGVTKLNGGAISVTTILRGGRGGDYYIKMRGMKKWGIYLKIGGINTLGALRLRYFCLI